MFPVEIMKLRNGAPLAQVYIYDTTASNSGVGHPVTATYGLNSTGVGEINTVTAWTWLLNGLNSDYQVRATLISGTSPSGSTLNSWLSLSTARAWSLTATLGNEIVTCTMLVEIRRISDNVVIDSATITIYAETGSI